MKKLITMSIIGTAMLTSCAMTESTVMPRGNNEFEVVTTGYSKQGAIKAALEQANKTCDQHYKKPAVRYQYTSTQHEWSEVTKMFIDTYTTTMTFKCQ